MHELSEVEYGEVLHAARELLDGERHSNSEQVDRSLNRLGELLLTGAGRRPALGLTEAQAELLLYVETYIAHNGYSPSYREMRSALGYTSLGEIHRLVGCLVERGRMAKLERRARSLSVIQPLKLADLALIESHRRDRISTRFAKGAA